MHKVVWKGLLPLKTCFRRFFRFFCNPVLWGNSVSLWWVWPLKLGRCHLDSCLLTKFGGQCSSELKCLQCRSWAARFDSFQFLFYSAPLQKINAWHNIVEVLIIPHQNTWSLGDTSQIPSVPEGFFSTGWVWEKTKHQHLHGCARLDSLGVFSPHADHLGSRGLLARWRGDAGALCVFGGGYGWGPGGSGAPRPQHPGRAPRFRPGGGGRDRALGAGTAPWERDSARGTRQSSRDGTLVARPAQAAEPWARQVGAARVARAGGSHTELCPGAVWGSGDPALESSPQVLAVSNAPLTASQYQRCFAEEEKT